MAVSTTVKLFVALRSHNRCAFADCRQLLTRDGVVAKNATVGEAAHIFGEKEGSARYVGSMTDAERNSETNLIYLCPLCHTKIDKQEADFPADMLIKVRSEHEAWAEQQLDNEMSSIGFAELEVACKALATGNFSQSGNFEVISPDDKIKKNNLTQSVRSLITMGLSQSHEVANYLTQVAQLDSNFPEQLSAGFKMKYLELKLRCSGDHLFMELLNYAQRGHSDFRHEAAALAIQCHLFQLCEVFEK